MPECQGKLYVQSSPAPIPEEDLRDVEERERSPTVRVSEPVSTNYKAWDRLIHHPGATGWPRSRLPGPSPIALHFSLSDRGMAPPRTKRGSLGPAPNHSYGRALASLRLLSLYSGGHSRSPLPCITPFQTGHTMGSALGFVFSIFAETLQSSCDLVLFRQVCKCRKGACEDISLLRVTRREG